MYIIIFLPLNQASHSVLLATNHLWIATMVGPVLVRSAPLQWMKLCELVRTPRCVFLLIQRSGAVLRYSPATAWQNNFLYTKGNSSMSWANGDSHAWRFDFSNSYIMPVVVKSIKKSRYTPQSKAKKCDSLLPTIFALKYIQRNSNPWRRQNNCSNSSLTTNLLSFLKGYIRKP